VGNGYSDVVCDKTDGLLAGYHAFDSTCTVRRDRVHGDGEDRAHGSIVMMERQGSW
jgi:hypothetical protein